MRDSAADQDRHCPSREQWLELLNAEAGAGHDESLQEHVGTCAACQTLLSDLAGTLDATLFKGLAADSGGGADSLPPTVVEEPRPEFMARLRALAITREATSPDHATTTAIGAPELPGLEILEKLGRAPDSREPSACFHRRF